MNEEGYTSWKIDDKDVSDADGFGAGIGQDRVGTKIFEGNKQVFAGFGPGLLDPNNLRKGK